jgi:large subunit ribosomal protein L29
MKAKEARQMGLAALHEKVAELRSELAKEKALASGGTRPENPGKIKSIRRAIARILTIAREKEIEKEEEKTKKRGVT